MKGYPKIDVRDEFRLKCTVCDFAVDAHDEDTAFYWANEHIYGYETDSHHPNLGHEVEITKVSIAKRAE